MTNFSLAKGYRFNWNKVGGKCPACNAYDKPKGGVLEMRGKKHLRCNRYPECKFITGSFQKELTGRKRRRRKQRGDKLKNL